MSDYDDNNRDNYDSLAYKKKYKLNAKNNKLKLSFEDDDDEEENEEEKEESESKSSLKKSKKTLYKEKSMFKNCGVMSSLEEIHPKKTEQEYLAQIEQLQNELDLEKKISESIKDSPDYTSQINELQNILNENNIKLRQLKLTNKNQDKALKKLRKQLDEEINKLESSKFSNKNNSSQKIKLKIISPNKKKEISKSEAINIVLKVKDKEISDTLKKMTSIKKENELLRKELYKNNDYQDNISIIDSSRECSQKIKELLKESKILNNQLETHQKCLKEFEKYKKEIEQLKNILKNIKENKNQININIRNKQLELNKKYSIEEKPILKKCLSPRNNLFKLKIYKKFNDDNFGNKNYQKDIILPSISTTQLINSPTKSILTTEFCEKLKKYFGEKEEEYNDLIEKISEIEQKGFSIRNKHKNELKIFTVQIGNLGEQFKSLNTERKEKGSNIKVMKFKLHIIKSETKHVIKEFQSLKLKLENVKKTSDQKDNVISVLLGKISSIKNKAKKKLEKQKEDKIEKYVDNIKNEHKNNENKKKVKVGLEKILETIKEEKPNKTQHKKTLFRTKTTNFTNRKSFSSENELSLKNNLNDNNSTTQSIGKLLIRTKRSRKSTFNSKKSAK